MRWTLLLVLAILAFCPGSFALQVGDQVKINEIYYCYPEGYTVYQDQFVELYNAGSTTCYLDGALICRGIPAELFSAWRFPGNVGGSTIPIEPGQYILIA